MNDYRVVKVGGVTDIRGGDKWVISGQKDYKFLGT